MSLKVNTEDAISYAVYISHDKQNAKREIACTAKTTTEIAAKIINLIYAIKNPDNNNNNTTYSIDVAIAFGRTELTFVTDIPYRTITTDVESIEDFIVMNMITKIDFRRFLAEINLNRTFHRDSKLYDVEFIKLFALSISSPELSAPATTCLQRIFALADGRRYDQKQLYVDVFGKDKPKKKIDDATKKELNAAYGALGTGDWATFSEYTVNATCQKCHKKFNPPQHSKSNYMYSFRYCDDCLNVIVDAYENFINTVNDKGEKK